MRLKYNDAKAYCTKYNFEKVFYIYAIIVRVYCLERALQEYLAYIR